MFIINRFGCSILLDSPDHMNLVYRQVHKMLVEVVEAVELDRECMVLVEEGTVELHMVVGKMVDRVPVDTQYKQVVVDMGQPNMVVVVGMMADRLLVGILCTVEVEVDMVLPYMVVEVEDKMVGMVGIVRTVVEQNMEEPCRVVGVVGKLAGTLVVEVEVVQHMVYMGEEVKHMVVPYMEVVLEGKRLGMVLAVVVVEEVHMAHMVGVEVDKQQSCMVEVEVDILVDILEVVDLEELHSKMMNMLVHTTKNMGMHMLQL